MKQREILCLTMCGNTPWAFGRPPYLRSKLTGKCEPVGEIALRTKGDTGKASSPWQSLQVVLSHGYLIRELTNTFGKLMTPFLQTQKPSGVSPGIGNGPNGQTILFQSNVLTNSHEFRSRRSGQLSGDVWRSSGTLLGDCRVGACTKAYCVSKGTSEAWSSRTPDLTANGAHTDKSAQPELIESSPMRRPSGGASVVVRDGNTVHMAKGSRMFRFERPKGSLIERLFNEH